MKLAKNSGAYSSVHQWDMEAGGGSLPPEVASDSFDAAVMIHVLEHMPKPVSLGLLRALENISRKIVAVVPLGWSPEKAYSAERTGDYYEWHKSE